MKSTDGADEVQPGALSPTGQTPGVRWLEHTADAGFTVEGASAVEVYARCVRALSSLMFGESLVSAKQELQLELEGEDRAERLVALLEEVLFRFEVDGFVTAEAAVADDPAGPGKVLAVLRGERFDPQRHRLEREVKAITWHQLAFEVGPDGAEATVVVDL